MFEIIGDYVRQNFEQSSPELPQQSIRRYQSPIPIIPTQKNSRDLKKVRDRNQNSNNTRN